MSGRFAVIMAGGSGTRFWPESRQNKPKQLLDLLGSGKSLLRFTYERTARIVPPGNIYVVTGEKIAGEVRGSIPELNDENVLKEPVGRNTAPCIGWASLRIFTRDPGALVAVLPSDHLILNEDEFARIINRSFGRLEKEDRIMTVGIMPTRPETGYGYIESGETVSEEIKSVRRFVEKPDSETAKKYLERGSFYWNGGIFIFRAGRMIEEIEEKLPDVFSALRAMQDAFSGGGISDENNVTRKVFPGIKGISIDYGVMEKAEGVEVIPADFGWSDLGSWRAIYEKIQKDGSGNALRGAGSLITHDAGGCLASTQQEKVVAIVGLENVVIVDTPDALLVCSMDKDQDVREIVAELKRKKMPGV